MDRINGKDTADIGQSRRGFKDQDAVKGIAGTELQAAWLNSLQEEILKVIEGAGIKPDAADWGQLAAAIGKSALPPFSWNINWMAINGMDTAAPPDNAPEGDIYLIPAGASGAWAEKSGQLAIKQKTGWLFARPKDGHGIGLPNGDVYVRVNDSYVPLTDKIREWLPSQFPLFTGENSLTNPNAKMCYGWTRLPNGLILQWGGYRGYYSNDRFSKGIWESPPINVKFPITFPKGVFQVLVSVVSDIENPAEEGTWLYSFKDSGFVAGISTRESHAPYNLDCSYIALGN